MRTKIFFSFFLLIISFVYGQYPNREDVVWARMVPAGTITLDGNLTESAWNNATTINIRYGQTNPLPTSGWRPEFQENVYWDKTNATIKFLVTTDNKLYLGFNIPDSSVGGIGDWARWDGILMSIKDKKSTGRPAAPVEYFYTWWYASINIPNFQIIPGMPPRFIGRYGTWGDTARTPQQREAWDAAYKVTNGLSCRDVLPNNTLENDQAWIVEMKIDLTPLGYNVNRPNGDVVALNFSIWDGDWIWANNPMKVASARTWFQSPWGNVNAMNAIRVYARPDVTPSTTNLPVIQPDAIIPNGSNFPEPTINGNLNEAVWNGAFDVNIAWDDSLLRNTYPTIGPLLSGQFQPELGGNPRPPVLDPVSAKAKMFFRGQHLYLAADINDQLIQGRNEYDRYDGVRFVLGDRDDFNVDNVMTFRQLMVNFNAAGQAVASEYLKELVDSGYASFGVRLKGNSTVNNNNDIDEGYQVEIKLNLAKLGYPSNLGDKLLFGGVMIMDGDSFDDSLANYGTRTWWFREHDGGPATAWMVMDPNTPVSVDGLNEVTIPNDLEIYGNYPNPFNPTTKIKYAIPESGTVTFTFFNALGEEISSNTIDLNTSGFYEYEFNSDGLSSGIYIYRVSFKSSNKSEISIKSGK
ncbi:MAG: T9SS type A sorting domain-containing protein, partial [Ignavibacterium sp.]|nr:T9SS type A sorting domain-containing protein [Ignavibacterium sp.]MDW8374202.1 T9SS type A sorting domain-containing protein [Ignavibacteriales bacterium]